MFLVSPSDIEWWYMVECVHTHTHARTHTYARAHTHTHTLKVMTFDPLFSGIFIQLWRQMRSQKRERESPVPVVCWCASACKQSDNGRTHLWVDQFIAQLQNEERYIWSEVSKTVSRKDNCIVSSHATQKQNIPILSLMTSSHRQNPVSTSYFRKIIAGVISTQVDGFISGKIWNRYTSKHTDSLGMKF